MARIVEAWPTLPAHIKAAVLALVGTSTATSPSTDDDGSDLLPWEKKTQ